MADFNPNPHPYDDPQYQETRRVALGIIPRSNFLSAVNRYSGVIFGGLATAAAAAIVVGVINIGLWGGLALIGGALLAAGVSIYAAYKDENMSKRAAYDYNEAYQVAQARLNGKELAQALNETMGQKMDTMGQDLTNLRTENQQTQRAIAELQKKINWQERESTKDEIPRVLQ
jgi:uncharacterized protein HemX